MAQMDFFRRPMLAGNTLTRQTVASVRGDLRRSDADGFSAVPYFPGIVGGETLLISIDGAAAVTATITAADFTTVLNDIAAALGAGAIAFDSDGCIGIKSVALGSSGSIEITGGTGAALLGFYLNKNKYKSLGGEIQSTSEARRGNAFGTGFPTKGENFTTESLQRGLARLSSNLDVLYSESARNDVVVRQLGFTNIDGTRLQITTNTEKLFTGLGLLSNASVKEDLAQYFYLVDTVTKQPAKSRVVAVVRGAPGGGVPFANATTWSGGGSAGNILGVSLEKISASNITSIFGGRVVECPAANFSDVQPGDFATIAGATNVSPFSNNGQRWVVEEVLSTTTLALRPMSKSELAQVGFTTGDVQPVIELNDKKTGLEVFGTLTVRTGTFCSGIGAGISVVVSPPIPTGATYTLFAAQPVSKRDRTVFDDQRSSGGPFLEFVSDLDPVANWTLSGLVATFGGGNCNITSGRIVWHGRVYDLPAQVFTAASFVDGINYVYWDEATGNYAIAANAAGFYQVLDPASGTKGHAVAVVTRAAGAITSVTPMTRLRGEKAIPVTVGTGGQFPDLIQATVWARAIEANYAEGTTATGTYPHFEFILLNDTTTNNQNPVLPNPGCIVRGINPRVKLNLGTGFFNVLSNYAEIRDLVISGTGTKCLAVTGTAASKVAFVNVTHDASIGASFTNLVETSGGTIAKLWVTDSSFMLKQSISIAAGTVQGVNEIVLRNSKFTYDGTGAVVPHIISHPTSFATPWNGDLLAVDGCDFLGAWGATTADLNPIFVSATGSTSSIFIRNTRFSLGVFTSANNNLFINATGGARLFLNSFVMTEGQIQRVINGTENTKCYNCTFRCDPATAVAALTGHTFENCSVTHADTVGAGSGIGIDILTTGVVADCSLSGPFNTAIQVATADAQILNNRIDQFRQANGTPVTSISVTAGGAGSLIQGNIIVWATSAATLSGLTCITSGADRTSIIGNKCYFPSPTVASTTFWGILNGGVGGITSQNLVFMTTTGTAAASQACNGLDISGTEQTCTGNVVVLTGSTTQNWRGIRWTPSLGTLSGNYIKSYGRTITTSTVPDATIISNNEFVSTTANSLSGPHAVNIGGSVTGNRFAAGNAANGVSCGYGSYSNNHFYTSVFVDNGLGGFGLTNFVFSGNYISGNFDALTNSPNWSKMDVVGNTIEGNVSISFSAVVGSPPHLLFGSNQVTGSVSLTSTVTVAYVVTGNEADSFNVSLQGSTALFQSNRTYTGSATVAANSATVDSNIIATDLTVTHGNDPTSNATSARIVGNQIGDDLSVNTRYSEISNNWIADDVSISRPTGFAASPGTCTFSFNNCGGDFQADTIDTGTYLFSDVLVHGNNFFATTISTWSAKGTHCYVTNNFITPTNGVLVTVGGSNVQFGNNQVYATAFTSGANQSTRVTLTHTSALGRYWAHDNFIYGRMDVDTGIGEGYFDANSIYSFWNGSAGLTISGVITTVCHFTNNTITADNNGVAQDFVGYNIFVNGAVANVFLQGNRLRITGLSLVYTNTFIHANIVLQNGGGGATANRVLLEGNIIDKPAGATISGFLQTTEQFRANNLSNFFAVGNLLFNNNALGLTVGRGDPLLNVGPTDPYIIAV